MEAPERDRLVKEHMPIVNKVVAQERRKLSADQALTEEMRSFALVGLLAAMGDFDPRKGTTFRFYAQNKIRWAIYDGLRKMGWFPRHLRKKITFYRHAHEMMSLASETQPPPRDAVDAVHRLSDRLKELATAYVTSYTADSENEPASVPPQAESNLMKKEASTMIKEIVDNLPEKQKKVIVAYFFEDKKISEIATELRLSNSWISKILNSGLKQIRQTLSDTPELLHAFSDPL